jgi:hypothetical protein
VIAELIELILVETSKKRFRESFVKLEIENLEAQTHSLDILWVRAS